MTGPPVLGGIASLASRFGRNPRSAPILLFGAVFLALSSGLRLAIVLREYEAVDLGRIGLLEALLVGLARDLLAFSWIALPLAAYLALAPSRLLRTRFHRVLMRAGFFLATFVLLFELTAEWFFWAEFQARFNFIALDYLVYTTEVLDNILESYPVPVIVACQAAGALAISLALRARLGTALAFDASPAPRFGVLVAFGLICGFDLSSMDPPPSLIGSNRYVQQASLNGLATLFEAFRDPILDYETFYRTLPADDSFHRARELTETDAATFFSSDIEDFTRHVDNDGPERRLNVMLIVVESLSADFLGCYGDDRQLTPELDALASDALVFDNFFATGCRTVRGLEALSLMVPPTPGQSIVHREANQNLFSSGMLFREKGYQTKFLYGGFGYFDEMNSFFSGNGFEVIDRSDFDDDEIRFSNAWGVCDEDLFAKVTREADASAASGSPFFFLVMTTSNHRPYTYPDVVDIPPGNGRNGAVQYADHAIGRLVEEARSRPWFDDTLFVIVADHCANCAGKAHLNLDKHHIPFLLYAPGIVPPGRVARLGSQIDLVPTVLDVLGQDYFTRGYGNSLLGPGEGRALVANYENVGLYRDGQLVVLLPRKGAVCYAVKQPGFELQDESLNAQLVSDAIAYYQTAASLYARGRLAYEDFN